MNIPTAPPRETLNHCKCCRVDDRHIVLLRQQQTQHSCATSCDRAPLQHRPPRHSSKPHHRHSRLPCGFPTRGLSSRLSQKRPAQNEAGQESSLNSAHAAKARRLNAARSFYPSFGSSTSSSTKSATSDSSPSCSTSTVSSSGEACAASSRSSASAVSAGVCISASGIGSTRPGLLVLCRHPVFPADLRVPSTRAG